MASFDYKHLIAAVIGVALGTAGAYFGIDFSKSCPPSVVVSAPASK